MKEWEERIAETKPYAIDPKMVCQAWLRVKANGGVAGVDGQSIEDFERKLDDNLYKLWNRMSSGSYFPKPVRLCPIPKRDGGQRVLGIPTVTDRVAQMVGVLFMEPDVDPKFHPDSYGYRPGKSAHDAVGMARQRCWRYDWVIDLDIKGYFDTIDHELLMKAVGRHVKEKWLLLFVGFTPAVSPQAQKSMQYEIRTWHLKSCTTQSLEDLAGRINPVVRGWMNYYGRYCRSALNPVPRQVELALSGWAMRKSKMLHRRHVASLRWLASVRRATPNLFAHWAASGANG